MSAQVKRRKLLQGLGALGGSSLLGSSALAQAKDTWPSKPIRLVVPFNAGGVTDIIARTIGDALSKRVGQPVLVDNRGGAAGILGTDHVAKAPADGYTLLVALSNSMLTNQFLYTKLPYNPQKDLALISQIAVSPVTLVVHPSVPANNMKELLTYVKANKGKLAYGSWGVGSYAHLAGAYMSKSMDADMNHIPYKGEAPMVQELIGGQLQFCFSSALNTKAFIDSGRLKAIGVTGKERMDVLPNLPTLYEQGVQDDIYLVLGWIAVGAPAGLPKEIVDQLYGHLREIAKDPKVQERFVSSGFISMMNSPEAFRKNYQRDMPIWKTLVESADARLD